MDICLLDPDPAFTNLLAQALSKKGFRVSTFSSPEALLRALKERQEQPALILTEVHLEEGANCFDVQEWLQSELLKAGHIPPVWVCTAYDDPALKTFAKLSGIGHWWFKNQTTDALAQAISRQMPPSEETKELVFRQ